MRSFIFDFNGTLYLDKELHRMAWKQFMAEHGIHVTDDDFEKHMYGPANGAIVQHFMGSDLPQELAEKGNKVKDADGNEGNYRQGLVDGMDGTAFDAYSFPIRYESGSNGASNEVHYVSVDGVAQVTGELGDDGQLAAGHRQQVGDAEYVQRKLKQQHPRRGYGSDGVKRGGAFARAAHRVDRHDRFQGHGAPPHTATGILPEAAMPAATPIMLPSAMPQSKKRSGNAF